MNQYNTLINKIRDKLNRDRHFKEMLKGGAITFVIKMTGMFLSYVVIFLVSKNTGAKGVGLYNLFNQILIVLSMILGLGMNISILRFIGQYNNDSDRPRIHYLYKNMIRLVAPLSVLVSLLLFLCAEDIAIYFDKNEEHVECLRLVALALPFFAINQICVEFIRGFKKLIISELIRSITLPVIIIVSIFILGQRSLGIIEIIYFFVMGTLANLIISSVSIRIQLKNIPNNNTLIITQREFLKTSIPMMITSISSSLIAALPIFFLDYFSSQSNVGIFSIVFRIAQFISIILLVVNTIAAPKFAELFWADKKKELQLLITKSTKIMFWVAFFLSVMVIISSNWILKLFGAEFVEGNWALVILVIGQFVNAATGSVGLILNMSGNQIALRNINLLALLMLWICGIFVIPRMPLIGASVCYSIVFITINILSVIYVKNNLKITTFYFPVPFKNQG